MMLIALLLSTVFTASPAPAPKTKCTSKELKRLDCRLTIDRYNLRLTDKTIAWTDGVWHTVDPMPLSGEGVSWQAVHFDFFDKHPVVQLWLWDKGTGQSLVQSLHWYVADAEKRKFTVLAEGVVRKRHVREPLTVLPGAEGGAPAPAPATDAKAPPKFLYDAEEKHGLRALNGGRLEWKLGGQTKILELKKVENGI